MAPRGPREGPKRRRGDWAAWARGPGCPQDGLRVSKTVQEGDQKTPKKPQRRQRAPWLPTAKRNNELLAPRLPSAK
eukprot:6168898-Pyramimonas_sp.AAC.1